MQVQSLGWEDPLEEATATHSSMLAWEIPWTEEPGSCSPWGHRELNSTEQMGTHVTVDTAKLAAFFQFCGHHAAPPLFLLCVFRTLLHL